MEQLIYLQNTPDRRKYNDVIRKRLERAEIPYSEKSGGYGYWLSVEASDLAAANRIVLGVSHTNPTYW